MPTTITVAGKVVNEAGHALAGATVSLFDGPTEVVGARSSETGGFRIITDVDTTPHSWKIVASKEEFEPFERAVSEHGASDLLITLTRVGRGGTPSKPSATINLAGTVFSKTGETLSGAKLKIFAGDTQIGGVDSGPNGEFEFSDETDAQETRWSAVVTKEGFKTLKQALNSNKGLGLRLILDPIPLPPPPPPPPWRTLITAAAVLILIGLVILLFLHRKAPSITFTANPITGVAPLDVQFAVTDAPDSTSFQWFFGDGATDTNRAPKHLFKGPGVYQTILVASQSRRKPAVVMQAIQVAAPLMVRFSASPDHGPPPLQVHFLNLSSPATADWEWNFGQGNVSKTRDPQPVTYKNDGTFDVTLTAGGPAFLPGTHNSSTSKVVVAKGTPLTPTFEPNPAVGESPLEVSFQITSIERDFPKFDSWNFGDKSPTNSERSPKHTYEAPGTYQVLLKMRDAKNNLHTSARYVLVKSRLKEVPDIIGLDLKTAERRVREAGFAISERPLPLASVAARLYGDHVISQCPPGTAMLATNASVTLFVGRNETQK
jgi:PKD repeat protein